MITRKVRKERWGGEQEVFIDEITGQEYRRIVGGLAWPFGGKPGFAVVVGEALQEDPATKARKLRVLAEVEEHDAGNLLRRCQEWRGRYKVGDWLGDTFNQPMMWILRSFNENMEGERLSIRTVTQASDPGGLAYFLHMIKECLRQNWKILEFGPQSKLPGYLGQISREEAGACPAEYPPIAALGFAVVKLLTTSPPEPRKVGSEVSPLAM